MAKIKVIIKKSMKILILGLKILFFVFTLKCIFDCFGVVYHKMSNFSEDELQWTEAMADIDSATFVSDKGNTSILIKKYIYTDNTRNPFYTISSVIDVITRNPYVHEAKSEYGYDIQSETDTLDGFLEIRKPIDSARVDFFYGLGETRTLERREPLEPKTFDLKGKEIDNCLVLDSTRIVALQTIVKFNAYLTNFYIMDVEPPKVDKYVISKEYGPIYYRLTTGEEFFRQLD